MPRHPLAALAPLLAWAGMVAACGGGPPFDLAAHLIASINVGILVIAVSRFVIPVVMVLVYRQRSVSSLPTFIAFGTFIVATGVSGILRVPADEQLISYVWFAIAVWVNAACSWLAVASMVRDLHSFSHFAAARERVRVGLAAQLAYLNALDREG